MKRSKIIAVVLVVLIMVGALVLASCKDKGQGCFDTFECSFATGYCFDESCAVSVGAHATPQNTTATCDCD
jgi:hypothetical protein